MSRATRPIREAIARLGSRRPTDAMRIMSARGLSSNDPGAGWAIDEGLGWLCRAQDSSASADGGVASHYHARRGWQTSYPETTGYIVPTILDCAKRRADEPLRERARRMLDWLVSIQLEDGSFQGGRIGVQPVVPVTFNTGQILLGLAAGTGELDGRYREPMRAAADWLVATQNPDGSWSSHPSALTAPGAKTYEIHVAWGLFEAARQAPEEGYGRAGLANVDWALGLQLENGWLAKCDLKDHGQPLTHAIGYALRGILEAYRFDGARRYLDAAALMGDALMRVMGDDGFIPGRLDSNWNGTVSWSCLTGVSQIAACWFMLHEHTDDERYAEAARIANLYVRRTVHATGPEAIRGGVPGSLPAAGAYMPYSVLSWATKFHIDAGLMESDLSDEGPAIDPGDGGGTRS